MDGGTFDHLFGTDVQNAGLLTNIRKVTPVPCRIAKGYMWLQVKADLMLNGTILRDGFINPYNSLTLVSEGKLSLFEQWWFIRDYRGCQFGWSGGADDHTAADVHWGWAQGVLFYLPQEIIPVQDCSMLCEGTSAQLSMEEWSAMSPGDATAQWLMNDGMFAMMVAPEATNTSDFQ